MLTTRSSRWSGQPRSGNPLRAFRRGFQLFARRAAVWRLCAVVVPLALLAAASIAEQARYSQTDVEATYLYDFTKFVTWPPAAPGSPLTICVLGGGPVIDPLHRLITNTVIGGHPLAVAEVENALDAQSCSVLFLPGTSQASHEEMLAMLHGRPVLTVSDSPGFIDGGGMVQFVVHGGRVRFSINLTAANQNGIRISAELLKVALSIKGHPLPEAQP